MRMPQALGTRAVPRALHPVWVRRAARVRRRGQGVSEIQEELLRRPAPLRARRAERQHSREAEALAMLLAGVVATFASVTLVAGSDVLTHPHSNAAARGLAVAL